MEGVVALFCRFCLRQTLELSLKCRLFLLAEGISDAYHGTLISLPERCSEPRPVQ